MIFESTDLHGVLLVKPDRFDDERGFLARSWGEDEFEKHGLVGRMVQRNLSYNRKAGTLRGMHYQHAPHAETKLVSCIAGAVFDVAVDLRRDSPTCGRWFGAELRPETGEMLYIPVGLGHGFIALEPDSVVEYLISAFYAPSAADGVRWDDPYFGIQWPREATIVSARDRAWARFDPAKLLDS